MGRFLFLAVAGGLLGTTQSYADDAYNYEDKYKLIEIENADPANLPLNAIIKNEVVETIKYYDKMTGQEVAADDRVEGTDYQTVADKTVVSKYYMPEIVQKEFGDLENKDADTAQYFKWETDSHNRTVLGVGTAEDYDFAYYRNDKREEITNAADRIVNDGKLAEINKNIYDVDSTENILGIYNQEGGEITNITGDFAGNEITVKVKPYGVIYNEGNIGEINGNFVSNTDTETNGPFDDTGGVAIANKEDGVINKISGVFVNNIMNSEKDTWISTGAISNGYIRSDKISYIKEIEGIFIGNQVNVKHDNAYGGAISSINGQIDSIKGVFIGNSVYNANGNMHGGAIYALDSHIGEVSGVFIGNSAGYGGAITNGTYDKIVGDFIGNKVTNAGGAIVWVSSDYIGGNFIGNVSGKSSGAIYMGGANKADFVTIEANFVGNHAQAIGGAITNEGNKAKITGDFIGNYIENVKSSQTDAGIPGFANTSFGGALVADKCGGSGFFEISGDFIGNYIESVESRVYGGAIANHYDNGGIIGTITGNFASNHVHSGENAFGGAYSAQDAAQLDKVVGNFVGNYAKSDNGDASGGAVSNVDSNIDHIEGVFAANSAQGETSAYGGAIYNKNATLGTADTETAKGLLNASFYGNYASAANGKAYGGAIYSDSDITVVADNGESVFAGNYVQDVDGKRNEAVYMDGGQLNLTAVNNGVIDFEDDINGVDYALNLSGSNDGEVLFNNKVNGAKALSVASDAVLHLGKNAELNVAEYKSDNATLKLDMTVDADSETIQNGIINVSGDVVGNTKVIVNAENPATFEEAKTMFVNAANYEGGTAEQFEVSRVIGSPYMWQSVVNAGGEESGSHWYLSLTDERNPDFRYTSEVMAAAGLHEAALEQTRSMAHRVSEQVAGSKAYCPECGAERHRFGGQRLRLWAVAQGEYANVKKPLDMDAKIWGVEAGFDLQRDMYNVLGLFISYRQGDYDFSGKNKGAFATLASKLDIDSYLAGLYYRYDRNMNWVSATVYGGKQSADAKTNDGVAKFSSDGVEIGASLEVGHIITLSPAWHITPEVGLYYTQIDYDKAYDNVGKRYDWDDVKQLEAEAGLRVEKSFANGAVYVKPSVLQTITSGNRVRISNLDSKLTTYNDELLGRLEIGGNYEYNDRLSLDAWINYTYGSNYNATAGGLGISYKW